MNERTKRGDMLFKNLRLTHRIIASTVIIACGLLLFFYGVAGSRPTTHRLAARLTNSPHISTSQAELGIKNVEKLLPLARRLTLESLQALAADYNIEPAEIRVAARHIDEVQTIVLDENLGDKAEVNDEQPTEVRVGTDYARDLTTDGETMMLLGHELTHMAVRGGNLNAFVEQVAQRAEHAAGVSPASSQKEDLACDFVGEQALKRLVKSSTTNKEAAAKQLARVLDYDADDADEGDEEHLSQHATLKALLALDPELRPLLYKSTR